MLIDTDGSELEYDPTTDTYHIDYERYGESVSQAVLTAVAAAIGRPAYSFDPPLMAAIDPDALNKLFKPRHDGTWRESVVVQFRYQDCLITVRGDGRVSISPEQLGESLR